MDTYSMSHLADGTLIQDVRAGVVDDSHKLAVRLAQLGEIDERRLYLPAGYSSMHAWCTGELNYSEGAAYKRIHAARAARRFPVLFVVVADGRLHLSAICLLAPHLTTDNVEALLRSATQKTKAQIERLLAERFPRPDMTTVVRAIPTSSPLPIDQLPPGAVGTNAHSSVPMPEPAQAPAPRFVDAPIQRPKVTPLAPQRFGLQVTIDQGTHDKLRHAQALLGHQIPSGDVAQVLDRALDALISQLEKRKFAATDKQRRSRPRSTDNPRHIPAEVKRVVRKRDGERCTFKSETGHRCEARARQEFDHIQPVARGGQSTAGNVRLRCRAHNQYEAECAFGSGLMRQKRDEARRAAAIARTKAVRTNAADALPTQTHPGESAGLPL